MFNYFRTTWSWQTHDNLAKQRDASNWWLLHATHTDMSIKICPLGNLIGWLYGTFLLTRGFWLNHRLGRTVSLLIVISIMIGGYLLNLNVTIYAIPVLIAELFNCGFVKRDKYGTDAHIQHYRSHR